MYKSYKFFSLLTWLLLAAFLVTGCGGGGEQKQATDVKSDETKATKKIGIVLSSGGRGDKSFNDAAIAGLERAKKELGIEYKDIQPKEVAEDEKSLEFLAKEKYDLVIGVGFMMGDALAKVAAKYPESKFAIIDFHYDKGTPKNVVELNFKEHEGSFLAGVLAAMTSKSNTVGFVGGMNMPLIHRFEGGFSQGVKAVKPDAKILVGYAGTDPAAFNNPTKGKEIALDQIAKGADVIYHASGGTGQGVFEAATAKNIYAIGVDSNQNYVKPGFVIASMLKRVDVAVFNTVNNVVQDKYQGGVSSVFGLKEDGVGLTDLNKLTVEETTGVPAEDQSKIQKAKDSISQEAKAKVEEYKNKIISGQLTVEDWITGKPAK